MAVVLQLDPTNFKLLAQHYPSNIAVPTGGVFRHKTQNVMVTGYKSGKVMFQGVAEQAEATKWSKISNQNNHPQKQVPVKKSTHTTTSLPKNLSQLSVIGSDEVGTGSYFGPLTVVATFVAQANIPLLQSWGIADSKTLSDAEIIRLAKKIIQVLPYHVVNILPKTYNKYQQTLNANEIKARGHNLALKEVLLKITPTKPTAILIDQFTPAQTYWRYLQTTPDIVTENVFFATKAEQLHLAVAAASIIARWVELETMHTLSQQAHQLLPVGAGPNVDKVAANLINQGLNLNNFAKLHFANTKKAQSIAHHKSN